ncbi:MAG TPA: DUF1730 domain-containing protein, partial [Hyphomicrobiaceae bacterium]|nr:DUF1730 domain-containing protein [Hyphomicrobiaceae bacterium]
EGFDTVGVADLDALDARTAERLRAFLAEGRHGTMDWLAVRAEERGHPRRLWPAARMAIMLGLNYGPDADPLARLGEPTRGVVSIYAKRRDYHDVVKGKLKQLAQWLARESGADVKVFVDT